jgi:signal transduction histidine kinase
MAERVRLCGGRFHIESKVGKGTTLRIEIPLS